MESNFFGTEKIAKILMKMAPPVMLAQLIQALYNVVDSFFVGRYSESGLTALSIIYPIQLLMIALAVAGIAELLLRVFFGLFGNYFYMRSVVRKSKKWQEVPDNHGHCVSENQGFDR